MKSIRKGIEASDGQERSGNAAGRASVSGEPDTVETGERTVGSVKKVLLSPVRGEAAPITEASDEAFAGKMMGDGYIIRPEEGMAYAPKMQWYLLYFRQSMPWV